MFDTGAVPYQLTSDGLQLQTHPAWAAFIHTNQALLRGWARWEWLAFIQRRNPDVPELARKLIAPRGRTSLAGIKALWKAASSETGNSLRCFYSDEPLADGGFHLDHVIPWSFVLHDQPWNLVPCSSRVNSSKGDHIARQWRADIPRWAALHATMLMACKLSTPEPQWRHLVSGYVTGLQLDERVLALGSRDAHQLSQQLCESLESVVPPLMNRALALGYPGSWECRERRHQAHKK